MFRRSLSVAWIVLMLAGGAGAAPYNLDGAWIDVDYWASDGSPSPEFETIVVIDWNDTHGPYVTEAHAWGYRWSGSGTVLDALNAVDGAGPLDLTFGSGGGFLSHAAYADPSIDGDDHRTTDYSGWVWAASSADGGQTWDLNGGRLDDEPLGHNLIEAANWNPGDWTGENLSVPVPDPTSAVLMTLLMGLTGLRGRGQRRRNRPTLFDGNEETSRANLT